MLENPENSTIVYVTREIERALGETPSEKYRIISNDTVYGRTIQARLRLPASRHGSQGQYPEFVTLIKPGLAHNSGLLGTTELLDHPDSRNAIAKIYSPAFLVFKNTLRVESMATKQGWKLLNPPSQLSERIENKLSQIRWLGPLGEKYLPRHAVKQTKLITWKTDSFIIQWAHGHTGEGTMHIRSREDLAAIQEKFPDRMARLSAYIQGPSFTVNVVAGRDAVRVGNVSYQITGLAPYSDNEFSTIGNDWSLADKILSKTDQENIQSMVSEIGHKIVADGWRGLFGIDMIRDENTGKIYLIEINARQPASAVFESELQNAEREKGARGLTTFEAHLRALANQPLTEEIIRIKGGAQIIQRITKNIQGVFDSAVTALQAAGANVIAYENTAPNSDLLRLQVTGGLLEEHGSLNAKGHEFAEIIKSAKINLQY